MTTILQHIELHTWENYVEVCQKTEGNWFEFWDGKIIWRYEQKSVNQTIIEQILYYPNQLYSLNPEIMATPNHRKIITNLVGEVYAQIIGTDYNVYSENTNVETSGKKNSRVPDGVITQEPEIYDEKGNLTNPVSIFEVTSPSTKKVDENETLEEYTQLDSLKDYILISQEKCAVRHLSRQKNEDWKNKKLENQKDVIALLGAPVLLPLENYTRK